jgi:dUTP pyrophosphatase
MIIPIKKLEHAKDLPLPSYATPHSCGMDLVAAKSLSIEPGEHALVPAGISIALPEDFEAQIRPRSGLALKHKVTVLNAPGTIDADYRGEIAVILINLGKSSFKVTYGMRIAQMIIAPIVRTQWKQVISLPESQRNEQGFGSTGT